MNLNPRWAAVTCLCFLFSACQTVENSEEKNESIAPPALYNQFVTLPVADTLAITTTVPADSTGQGVSTTLWQEGIDSNLLAKIEFEPDTSDTEGFTFWKIPLDSKTEICLIGFHQNWFKNKSILLYDISTKSFKDLIPAATFYGGDGGQILTGAWLFDANQDGFADLTLRESEHYIQMAEPEPKEGYKEAVRQMMWDTSAQTFQPAMGVDTSLIGKFPLPWWE